MTIVGILEQQGMETMLKQSASTMHASGRCACSDVLSRRQFVVGSLAVGAAAALPAKGVLAQQRVLIDTHHHFSPPEYQKLWLDWEDARKIPHFSGQVAW